MKEIRHRVGIQCALSEAFKAVYQPAKLELWWSASASGAAALGSQIELQFPGFPNLVWKIAELSERERVRLKLISGPAPWSGSELIFDFLETKEQVFLTLTHHTASGNAGRGVSIFLHEVANVPSKSQAAARKLVKECLTQRILKFSTIFNK